MKQSHLRALTGALGGRAHLVASLHVLSQPTLEADDHAFLADVAHELHSLDLLRWLARCPPDGPRAKIMARLAAEARRDPQRFEAEVLGARLTFLTDDDWAELHDQLGPEPPRGLARRILVNTSGSAVYRALLAPPRPAPAPDVCLFPHAIDPFGLLDQPRPDPGADAALELSRCLFPVRNDENACITAIHLLLASSPARASLLLAAADAGLLPRLGDPIRLLPESTRFTCEHRSDDGTASREAAIRWLAGHEMGDGGLGWLVLQVEAALDRGAPTLALLAELCPATLRAVWARSARLRGRVDDERRGATPAHLEALQSLLPWAISDEAILSRALLPGHQERSAEALIEAVTARVNTTDDGGECAALLGWLERHDTPRKALLELASRAIRRGVCGNDLLAWLAARLGTRSAWEQHGVGVLAALLERGAWSELTELFAQTWSAAAGGDRKPLRPGEPTSPSQPSTPSGFREAAHAAFALALVQHARAALAADNEAAALRALSALACLDPPARLNSVLHDLGRHTRSEAVRELIEINAGLVRHGGSREATLHGAVSAVHVLSSR